MSDDHKPLGELPENWTCKECGHTAGQYACIKPRSEMNCDDQATAEKYGTDPTQFASAEEIELCGYCGGSRWQKPQDDWTCPVCDGGPGNNCACSCPKG